MRLWFLVFVILCGFYKGACGKDSLDIEMKLKTLNKSALKTIKSEDGDIIDCIDIYKQHAFDHPALRDHKIQMEPSVEMVSKMTNVPYNGSSEPITFQTWSKSGECPIGTIPVRRVSIEDITRASSPSQFGKKTPPSYSFLDDALQNKSNLNITAANVVGPRPKDRSEAFLQAKGFNYVGVQSTINVWNPPRVQASDYSSAQVWLLNGIYKRIESLETIEVGWVVNPSLFKDSRTRLFIYWTADGYQRTGCFNLLCSGFVQTSHKISLGAAIQPISSRKQYHISVSVFLDPNGKWWLTIQNNVIGYWPREVFGNLRSKASAVQFGGEVHSPNVKKRPHTRTTMGSGSWASNGYSNACYHTNMRIEDSSLQLKFPEYLSQFSDEYNCYSTKLHKQTEKSEPYFYFGGPGQNRRCP